MALLKLCRCGQPIPIQQQACDACQLVKTDRHKLYDKYQRNQIAKAFYNSMDWKQLRQQALLRDNNLCVHCIKNNRIKSADMVDHIIPIMVDWSLRLALDNTQSLCNPCHNSKSAEDKKKYR